MEQAFFAGGCFWGLEYYFATQTGVMQTQVGYIGGHLENPSYEQVCAGDSTHAEAIAILFQPEQVSYTHLCKLFFELHDPTQLNRQGPDIGSQYRSAIFYTNAQQHSIAQELKDSLIAKGLAVVTQIQAATKFWLAEEYHQGYYTKTSDTPYCHSYTKRF
jgi:peptide methionine sulfoxide reductase msrA/msrB